MNPMPIMPLIALGLFGLYTLEFGVVGILPAIIDRFHVTISEADLLLGLFALTVAALGSFRSRRPIGDGFISMADNASPVVEANAVT
jgi:predicted MFS family arabinose efflux permease